MEQRFSLVTLGVSDLARSRRFYEEGLGWRRGNDNPDVAFYQLPGFILALWPREQLAADAGIEDDGEGRFGGFSLAYNCRDRAEVDAVMALARAAGGRILKPAAETFWGGYAGYFADPDGFFIEVAHNPFWRIEPDGRVFLSA